TKRASKAVAKTEPAPAEPKVSKRGQAAKAQAKVDVVAGDEELELEEEEIDEPDLAEVELVDDAVEAVDPDAEDEDDEEDDEDQEGFVIGVADDDAPVQQVMPAGATADPVKDYLKQIGKVALLNAEQEV